MKKNKFDLRSIFGLHSEKGTKEENLQIQHEMASKAKIAKRVLFSTDIQAVPMEAFDESNAPFTAIDEMIINPIDPSKTQLNHIKTITHQHDFVYGSNPEDIKKLLKAIAIIEYSKSSAVKSLLTRFKNILNSTDFKIVIISQCEGFLDEVNCLNPAVTYFQDIGKKIPELTFIAADYTVGQLATILINQIYHVAAVTAPTGLTLSDRNHAIQSDINRLDSMEANETSTNLLLYKGIEKFEQALSCMFEFELCYPQQARNFFPCTYHLYVQHCTPIFSPQIRSIVPPLFIFAPLFANTFELDVHIPLPPINKLSVDDIRKMGFGTKPLCLPYVILENGELVVSGTWSDLIPLTSQQIDKYSEMPLYKQPITLAGEACYYAALPHSNDIIYFDKQQNPSHLRVKVIHPEVAGLRPVLAAGIVHVSNGKIISAHPSGLYGIDNWTGH